MAEMRTGITVHGAASTSRPLGSAPRQARHTSSLAAKTLTNVPAVLTSWNAGRQGALVACSSQPKHAGSTGARPQQRDEFNYLKLDLPPPLNSRVSKSVFVKVRMSPWAMHSMAS